MKPRWAKQRNAAMTLFEVILVVAVLMLLAAFLLPDLARSRRRVSRINCINNLHQVCTAFRIWEGDNNDKYPMAISVTNGGAMELVATGNVIASYLVISNELSTPKILVCPEDSSRIVARTFGDFIANSNVSYFVGVDVTNEVDSRRFLSGDGNFETGGVPVKPGLVQFLTNTPIVWADTRHHHRGNIGFADGSVQQFNTANLRQALQQTGLITNRLAIP